MVEVECVRMKDKVAVVRYPCNLSKYEKKTLDDTDWRVEGGDGTHWLPEQLSYSIESIPKV